MDQRSDSDEDVELRIHSASHFQEQILSEGSIEMEQDFEVNINICSAEDCCAMGSTTAVLEIEELGVELSRTLNGAAVKVCQSACLGLCGKGPAVAVTCRDREAHVSTETFTEVNGPEKCAEVVNAAAKLCGHEPSERTTSSLMQRRADGMRWNALKTLGRHHRKKLNGARPRMLPTEELEEALRAEERAARSCEEKERAERRAERLRRMRERGVESEIASAILFPLASNKAKDAGTILGSGPVEKQPDLAA